MILVIGGAYQGQYEFVKNELNISDEKIYKDFHLGMKEWLEQGRKPKELTEQVLDGRYEVIISDEIGSGIVPIERDIRDWREQTGRALCEIAKRCDTVYRVQCGVAIKIKA